MCSVCVGFTNSSKAQLRLMVKHTHTHTATCFHALCLCDKHACLNESTGIMGVLGQAGFWGDLLVGGWNTKRRHYCYYYYFGSCCAFGVSRGKAGSVNGDVRCDTSRTAPRQREVASETCVRGERSPESPLVVFWGLSGGSTSCLLSS